MYQLDAYLTIGISVLFNKLRTAESVKILDAFHF